jgi:non-specific serine/threonine protein kinase
VRTEEASNRLWQSLDLDLLDRIAADHDNARAALIWLDEMGDSATCLRLAAAHGWYWFVRGFGGEGRAWLDRARNPLAGDATTRGWALMWASDIAILQNDLTAAAAMAEESTALFRELGNDFGLAAALTCLGNTMLRLGDQPRARVLLEECLMLARRLKHTLLTSVALANLTEFALHRGDLDEAEAHIEEALPLQSGRGNTWGTPIVLSLRAELSQDQGDPVSAARWYIRAITAAQAQQDNAIIGSALIGLGAIATKSGEVDLAVRLLGAAEAIRETFELWGVATAQGKHHRLADEARKILGDAAFATAWSAGRSLSPQKAVAEAMVFASTLSGSDDPSPS